MQMIPMLSNLPVEQLTRKGASKELSQDVSEPEAFQLLLQTNEQHSEGKAHVDQENLAKNIETLPLHGLFEEEDNSDFIPLTDEEVVSLHEVKAVLPTTIKTENFTVKEENIDELQLLVEEQNVLKNDEIDIKVAQKMFIEQEIIPFMNTIKSLLSFAKDDERLKEAASRLLPVLQNWTSLKQQVEEDALKPVLEEQLSKEQLNIFKFLESNVAKREFFAEQYRQDASITRSDLMNWLQVALERYADSNEQQGRVVTPTVTAQQAIPMQEVQQHTVHLQSLDRVDRISEELSQKLVTIIKESRFLTKPNHLQPMHQLQVVLKPEHLGQITVRFQQVEGNMMVNMIVTSQATKEMLEANIHQLKHLFSPHQVTIERDVAISDEEFFKEKQEKEDGNKEQLNESEESNDNDREEDAELDFESFIEQLTKGSAEQ